MTCRAATYAPPTPKQAAEIAAGSRLTHPCGAHWSGGSRAHCSGCGRLFNTVNGFDAHRQATAGRNRCLNPATLVNKNTGALLLQERDGVWYARLSGERPQHWNPTKEDA
jgi:hypothetical protein